MEANHEKRMYKLHSTKAVSGNVILTPRQFKGTEGSFSLCVDGSEKSVVALTPYVEDTAVGEWTGAGCDGRGMARTRRCLGRRTKRGGAAVSS